MGLPFAAMPSFVSWHVYNVCILDYQRFESSRYLVCVPPATYFYIEKYVLCLTFTLALLPLAVVLPIDVKVKLKHRMIHLHLHVFERMQTKLQNVSLLNVTSRWHLLSISGLCTLKCDGNDAIIIYTFRVHCRKH